MADTSNDLIAAAKPLLPAAIGGVAGMQVVDMLVALKTGRPMPPTD